MAGRAAGKVALMTGGGSGIGEATVMRFTEGDRAAWPPAQSVCSGRRRVGGDTGTRAAYRPCRCPKGVTAHSDRGSQYCGRDFPRPLKKFGMRSSMSRKGACGDDAVAERFFHALKVQAVQRGICHAGRDAQDGVRVRRDLLPSWAPALGDRTPEQFEQRKAARSGVGFRWGGSSKLLAVNPL